MSCIQIPIRDTLIFYTTATCNLCCTYCYIDKSASLQKIDKMLEQSFLDPNYYFDFSKKVINNKEDLRKVEFWGGETSQGLHRTYNLVQQLIEYYPNLKDFFMSTNFTLPQWFDEFYGFLKILSKYPERNFTFRVQLSIDGPEDINDKNRGQGVTKKWLAHYDELCETLLDNKPDNVFVEFNFKQTLSNQDFKILSTKDKVREYFKFFDDLIIQQSKYFTEKDNVRFNLNLPNVVSPGAYTQEDGKNFANYCKITRELEQENCFTYYHHLTTYVAKPQVEKDYKFTTSCTYCGAGINNIGLLPNNYISLCHMGFTQLLEEYKINSLKNHINDDTADVPVMKDLFIHNSATQSLCIPFEELDSRIEQYKLFFDDRSTFQIINETAFIRILAEAGQIDEQFKDEKMANKAAHYLYSTLPTCIRDNMSVTGTLTMQPMEMFKLLLNGATQYLIDWD